MGKLVCEAEMIVLLQLDMKTVHDMDSNLTEGQEMEILYHELMRTIPRDYLDMESVRKETACFYACIDSFGPNGLVHVCTYSSQQLL